MQFRMLKIVQHLNNSLSLIRLIFQILESNANVHCASSIRVPSRRVHFIRIARSFRVHVAQSAFRIQLVVISVLEIIFD